MTNPQWTDGFRSRLSVLLNRYGYSKAEMARKCGIPSRTLENYFKGHKPGIDALIALSNGLGVDIDWLLGEDTKKKHMRTDLIGEAAWLVLNDFLKAQPQYLQGAETLMNSGNPCKDPGSLAAQLEARIVAQYLLLDKQYAAPSLADAKTITSGDDKSSE